MREHAKHGLLPEGRDGAGDESTGRDVAGDGQEDNVVAGSEVFRRARSEGPQWVTKQDREAVVIIQAEEYERLSRARQPESLVEFFAKSPLAEVDLRFDRRSDYGRDIEL